MTAGQYRVYFLLFFLAISSWFLADLFEPKEVSKAKVADHTPDYFSIGYYKKEMDEGGLLKSELIADKMIRYGDDETTHLDKPVMTLYNPDVPPWVMKSEAAIMEADGDHLQLLGKVFISRAGTENLRAFKLNTSELKVKLSTSYAETALWAEIIDDQNTTEGIGLEITFKDPVRFKFLSKVKGRYVFN
jgi:lipopolysaccharide export system protein LptC